MSIEMENPITTSQLLLKEDMLEKTEPVVSNKNNQAPLDTEKMEIIRNKILNNELNINSEQVADKILSLEQEIFTQKK